MLPVTHSWQGQTRLKGRIWAISMFPLLEIALNSPVLIGLELASNPAPQGLLGFRSPKPVRDEARPRRRSGPYGKRLEQSPARTGRVKTVFTLVN